MGAYCPISNNKAGSSNVNTVYTVVVVVVVVVGFVGACTTRRIASDNNKGRESLIA